MDVIRDLYKLGKSLGYEPSSQNATNETHINFLCVFDKSGFVELKLCDANMQMPRVLDNRTSQDYPRFGYDNVGYVIGLNTDDAIKKSKGLAQEKLKLRFELFWNKVSSDLLEAGDKEVSSAAKLMAGKFSEVCKAAEKIIRKNEWKLRGNVVPVFAGDTFPITQRPSMISQWLKIYNSTIGDGPTADQDVPCLISGERKCNVTDTHPRVVGVAGTDKPTPFISFNIKVSQFNGHEQGMNYPVSKHVSHTYTQALNHLLEGSDRHRRRSAIVSDNITTVFWCVEFDTEFITDILDPFQIDETILSQAWNTLQSKNDDAHFHVLSLRGATSRIAILDYRTILFGNVKAALLDFRKEFSKMGTPNIYKLMEGIEVPNTMRPRVIEAVLCGSPYPEHLVNYVLKKSVCINSLTSSLWLKAILRRNNINIIPEAIA